MIMFLIFAIIFGAVIIAAANASVTKHDDHDYYLPPICNKRQPSVENTCAV